MRGSIVCVRAVEVSKSHCCSRASAGKIHCDIMFTFSFLRLIPSILRRLALPFFLDTYARQRWYHHHHHLSDSSNKGLISPGLAQSIQPISKTSKRVYQDELTPSLVKILMSLRHEPYWELLQKKVMLTQLNRWLTNRILLAIPL